MQLPQSFFFDMEPLSAQLSFEGLSSVLPQLELTDEAPVVPRERGAFCCIGALDMDESGVPPAAGVRSAGLAVSSRHGGTTLAADYSRLTLSDVVLQKGSCLTFFWQFISVDREPFNDFALFEAFPEGGTEPVHRALLCDVKELAHFDRIATGWLPYTWTLESDFKGKLSWLAANGQEQTSPDDLDVALEAFAYPPVLLLESIVSHPPEETVTCARSLRRRLRPRHRRG